MCGVVARKWRWLALALTVWPAMASAELVIIYDSGNTRPLAPLLEVFGESPPPAAEQSAPPEPQPGAADVEELLPIRSPGLSPGGVAKRAAGRPFARPFFLVGSDPMSRQWLATHRDRLVEIGAVGMLVQAEKVDDFRTTAALAHGLPILPASASDIAEALGLSHYPVLITRDGLEQ